jgi:hypothetical protein
MFRSDRIGNILALLRGRIFSSEPISSPTQARAGLSLENALI